MCWDLYSYTGLEFDTEMEKFQVATKADLKEAAIIEHKRRYEEERKSRIFNTRNRIFGVGFTYSIFDQF